MFFKNTKINGLNVDTVGHVLLKNITFLFKIIFLYFKIMLMY
jgi:hypothetical protein